MIRIVCRHIVIALRVSSSGERRPVETYGVQSGDWKQRRGSSCAFPRLGSGGYSGLRQAKSYTWLKSGRVPVTATKSLSLMSRGMDVIHVSLAALLILLLMGFAGQARGAEAQTLSCSTPETDPIVEIVRSGPFQGIDADAYAQENYDDLIGTISSANFRRFWDGTCGSYKVPVRIVAPKSASCDVGRLAHAGLVELMHPNSIGYDPPGAFSGLIHGWNDPVYDPLLDQGYMEAWGNLRAPFLFGDPAHGGSGVTYMGFQANNFGGELDYIASLPENSGIGLHLPRPQDYAVVLRDVSKWLRQAKTPETFVNAGRSDLCSVSDVIGFGYSYTANRLKAVLSDPHHLNSTWGGADPTFPRGRVIDGTLLGGLFGKPKQNHFSAADLALYVCPDVTASELSPAVCAASNDSSEGPMLVVRSEGDVQFFLTRGLRPDAAGRFDELDHFKVHEINAASHLEVPYFPLGPILESFGLDPSLSRQNPLDRSPVLRADLINLLANIRAGTPLPDSQFMEAHAPNSRSALAIISLDPVTGNGFGGVALPQAAAPLGLYRGIDCHGLFSADFDPSNPYHYARPPVGRGDLRIGRANYILETTSASPYRVCEYGGDISGLFTPYGVVDDALGSSFCRTLYPTRQAYSDKVIAAADRLIAGRFLLPQERDEIIAAAEAAADAFPECVPAQ